MDKRWLLMIFTMVASMGLSFAVANHVEKAVLPKSALEIYDVKYGADRQQRMDIYLPEKRASKLSKVFILIHGGGWMSGDKADFNSMAKFFRSNFPSYAVVNINYRLGTEKSIGNPKQLQDIAQAINYLNQNSSTLHTQKFYALVGISAGGHLALLYAYRYNAHNQVKSVCSIVGPTDFSDPGYTSNKLIGSSLKYFTGIATGYKSNPEIYDQISPAMHIAVSCPPTLLIYSGNDPLIPVTQGAILKSKLDKNKVYNEYYLYENAFHARWSGKQQSDIDKKARKFFTYHF